jgi:hypothetical protein
MSLWAFGARMQDHDVKYAVKTGAATAILAAPAFFEATRPTFMEYRGEWALISVSLVSRWLPVADMVKVERTSGSSFVLVLCRHVSHNRRRAFSYFDPKKSDLNRVHDAQTNSLSVHRILGTL